MRLYNKIRIIFIIALALLSAFFASYLYIQKSKHIQKLQKRYMQTALFTIEFFRNSRKSDALVQLRDNNLNLFLKESSFELEEEDKIKSVLNSARVIQKESIRRVEFEVLRYKRSFYLYLKHPKVKVLLKDKKRVIFSKDIIVFYFISLIFLLGLYLWIIRSLKPLKELQQKIQKVSDGDLSISLKSSKSDEIGDVSNAFDDALRKLESLIESRQLFLRTIMHELNTPIAKGKILNTFIEDDKLHAGYDRVFDRLELIVQEFSKIEQMLSSNYKLNIAPYNAIDLIENSLELMIIDDEVLENSIDIVEESPLIIYTDFALFSLALKNLIDNGVKYSSDMKVHIIISKNSISIISNGERFTNDIERYFKPFNPKGKGLGLGLYIVHTVTDILNIEFSYRYRENQNIFILNTKFNSTDSSAIM